MPLPSQPLCQLLTHYCPPQQPTFDLKQPVTGWNTGTLLNPPLMAINQRSWLASHSSETAENPNWSYLAFWSKVIFLSEWISLMAFASSWEISSCYAVAYRVVSLFFIATILWNKIANQLDLRWIKLLAITDIFSVDQCFWSSKGLNDRPWVGEEKALRLMN